MDTRSSPGGSIAVRLEAIASRLLKVFCVMDPLCFTCARRAAAVAAPATATGDATAVEAAAVEKAAEAEVWPCGVLGF